MLTSETGKLQALAINGGVKEENPLSSTLYIIIPFTSALDKTYPITSEQGNNFGRVDTFVIPDLNIFPKKGKYSNHAFGTF